MAEYKIEIYDGSQWDTSVGDPNTFNSVEAANQAIEELKKLEGWDDAQLRVVEV